MKTNKKILAVVTLCTMAFLVGCQEIMPPVTDAPKTETTIPQNNASVARFQDPVAKDHTAVDSAIKMAQEHTAILNENVVLKQNIQNLSAENDQLKKQIAALEPELKQTKKELEQANDFLIDMTTELNNWKMQVLGFQNEMRDVSKAQMKILLQIAQAMGAEVTSQQKNYKLSAVPGDTNE